MEAGLAAATRRQDGVCDGTLERSDPIAPSTASSQFVCVAGLATVPTRDGVLGSLVNPATAYHTNRRSKDWWAINSRLTRRYSTESNVSYPIMLDSCRRDKRQFSPPARAIS